MQQPHRVGHVAADHRVPGLRGQLTAVVGRRARSGRPTRPSRCPRGCRPCRRARPRAGRQKPPDGSCPRDAVTPRSIVPNVTARRNSPGVMLPGCRPCPGGALHEPPGGLVGRGRHPVQPAEQHDLAVEVVGLDGAGAAGQALPRRPAGRARRRPATRMMSPRRSRSSSTVATSMPARRSTASPSARTGREPRRRGRRPAPHSASTALPRFSSEFAVLPAHDVLARLRHEPCRSEVPREPLGGRVAAGRVAAEVEDAGDRVAVRDHDAGLEVAAGQHHVDAVDVGEVPQRRPLVGDAVLQADDRALETPGAFQGDERGPGVHALHREDDDVLGGLRGMLIRVELDDRVAGRLAQRQPVPADRLEMRAAGDDRHVVPGGREPARDHSPTAPAP